MKSSLWFPKSPWNHHQNHQISIKSPWNHHQIKSPSNHHQMTIKSPFNVMKFYYKFPEKAPNHHDIHELRHPSALPAAGPAPKALPLPERTRDLANILGRTADRWRGGKFGGKKPGDVMEKMWKTCGKDRGKTWKTCENMWKHVDKLGRIVETWPFDVVQWFFESSKTSIEKSIKFWSNRVIAWRLPSGWWLTYPSEKYESIGMIISNIG